MTWIKTVFLSLCLLFMVAQGSMAMDALATIGSGVLMQKGFDGSMYYTAGVDIPTITPESANYKVLTIADVLYSDRTFDQGTEVQAIRVMSTGHKQLPLKGLALGIGTGIYTFLDNDGENTINGVVRCGLSYEIAGMQLFGGGDVLPVPGPDLYAIGLTVTITAW